MSNEPLGGSPGRPWPLTFALSAGMGAGPTALYCMSAAGPAFLDDLGLGRADLGLLAAFCFAVSGLSSPVSGLVAEQRSRRVLLSAVFALSAAALCTLALADAIVVVMIGLALSGLAQALINPVSNELLALHSPTHQRGLLMGIKQSGIQFGQIITALAVIATASLGWRWGVAGLASLVVVLGVVAFRTVPMIPPEERSSRRAGTKARPRVTLPRGVYLLSLAMFISGAALQAINVYLPLFAAERLGFGPRAAASVLAVTGTLGLVSRLSWASYAARTRRPWVLLTAMMIAAMACASLLALASFQASPMIFWLAVSVDGGIAMAIGVVANVMLVARIPAIHISRSSGVLWVGLFSGFTVGPIALGALADATGSFTPGWLMVTGFFLVGAGLCSRLRDI